MKRKSDSDMAFLRTLKELIKDQTLSGINFYDGESAVGFIVYADDDTFDMFIIDNVFNEKVIEADLDSGPNGRAIIVEKDDDIDGIDFVFVKSTYKTEAIECIQHDVSHHFPVEKTSFFDLVSQGIYDNVNIMKLKEKTDKKSATKIKENKPSNMKLLLDSFDGNSPTHESEK